MYLKDPCRIKRFQNYFFKVPQFWSKTWQNVHPLLQTFTDNTDDNRYLTTSSPCFRVHLKKNNGKKKINSDTHANKLNFSKKNWHHPQQKKSTTQKHTHPFFIYLFMSQILALNFEKKKLNTHWPNNDKKCEKPQ